MEIRVSAEITGVGVESSSGVEQERAAPGPRSNSPNQKTNTQDKQNKPRSWVWWNTALILALEGQRKDDHQLKQRLGYI